jgi:hypothetical protein
MQALLGLFIFPIWGISSHTTCAPVTSHMPHVNILTRFSKRRNFRVTEHVEHVDLKNTSHAKKEHPRIKHMHNVQKNDWNAKRVQLTEVQAKNKWNFSSMRYSGIWITK